MELGNSVKQRNGDGKRRTGLKQQMPWLHLPVREMMLSTQSTLSLWLPRLICKVTDLSALEEDNQRLMTELVEVRVAKGYSSQEDLRSDEKVLRFYTRFSSFMVLMALYQLTFLREEQPSSLNLTILFLHL